MIASLIKKMANQGFDNLILCTVSEIDIDSLNCVCCPVNGDADILDVRLTVQDNGILVMPKIGSVVIVSMISKVHGYISLFSEIDSIGYTVKDKKLLFDQNGLKIEGTGGNFKSEIIELYEIVNSILTELLVFKVNTPVGPSVSVFPDNIVNLNKYKLQISTSKEKIKSILN